ncbi:MAG: redox-sensing transcriptional repressor Rex, partial [Oscillospiraceae bacterium]
YDLSVVYPELTVENVHLGDSLMSLGYRVRND